MKENSQIGKDPLTVMMPKEEEAEEGYPCMWDHKTKLF